MLEVEKTQKIKNHELVDELEKLKTNYKEKVYVLESELTEQKEKSSLLTLTSKNLRAEKKDQFTRVKSLISKEGFVLSQNEIDFHLSPTKDSKAKASKINSSLTNQKFLEEENQTLKTLLKDTQEQLEGLQNEIYPLRFLQGEVHSLRLNEKEHTKWLEESIKMNAKVKALEDRLESVLGQNREFSDKLGIQDEIVKNFQSLLKDNSVSFFFNQIRFCGRKCERIKWRVMSRTNACLKRT